MDKDFLDQIIAGLDQPINSKDSVLQNKNEKTHPVQVRESTYNQLKDIAFKHNVKLVNLVESLLGYALSNKDFRK